MRHIKITAALYAAALEQPNADLFLMDGRFSMTDDYIIGDDFDAAAADLRQLHSIAQSGVAGLLEYVGIGMMDASRRFGIPYATMCKWCSGERTCSHYVQGMMAEILMGTREPKRTCPQPLADSTTDDLKALRSAYGLTRAELVALTGIPKRSIENWEGGSRSCPPYVLKLIRYYLEHGGDVMDVIELSIHGDIFLIANNLTAQEIEAVENYTYQCFVINKRDIGIDAFIDEIRHVLQISLKKIDIVKVIAV